MNPKLFVCVTLCAAVISLVCIDTGKGRPMQNPTTVTPEELLERASRHASVTTSQELNRFVENCSQLVQYHERVECLKPELGISLCIPKTQDELAEQYQAEIQYNEQVFLLSEIPLTQYSGRDVLWYVGYPSRHFVAKNIIYPTCNVSSYKHIDLGADFFPRALMVVSQCDFCSDGEVSIPAATPVRNVKLLKRQWGECDENGNEIWTIDSPFPDNIYGFSVTCTPPYDK